MQVSSISDSSGQVAATDFDSSYPGNSDLTSAAPLSSDGGGGGGGGGGGSTAVSAPVQWTVGPTVQFGPVDTCDPTVSNLNICPASVLPNNVLLVAYTDSTANTFLLVNIPTQVISEPPANYPSPAGLWSFDYLLANPGAAPGSVTIQFSAVLVAPSDSSPVVAQEYATGTFDFWAIDDPTLTAAFGSIGSHEVKGTFTLFLGYCNEIAPSNPSEQPSQMGCPLD